VSIEISLGHKVGSYSWSKLVLTAHDILSQNTYKAKMHLPEIPKICDMMFPGMRGYKLKVPAAREIKLKLIER